MTYADYDTQLTKRLSVQPLGNNDFGLYNNAGVLKRRSLNCSAEYNVLEGFLAWTACRKCRSRKAGIAPFLRDMRLGAAVIV